MKIFSTVLLTLIALSAHAQTLTGRIVDRETGVALGAEVSTKGVIRNTGTGGVFRFNALRNDQELRVASAGYGDVVFNYKTSMAKDTLIIKMTRLDGILIDRVDISGGSYKKDSLNFRQYYQKELGWKQPKFMEGLATKGEYEREVQQGQRVNSTSSILSLDVLKIANLLSKKKKPNTKLKSRILEQERSDFLNKDFSAEKVQELTGLKGEALKKFMDQYQPSLRGTLITNEYELIDHVLSSYKKFKKENP